jgi:hypothetical protein
VPIESPTSGPPTTLVGFRVSDTRTAGSTVSEAVRVAPP